MARFDRAIPPGGKGNILLKFNSKGYQGVTRKSGVVYSNDPNNLSTTLTITANVKVPISVKPGRVMLKGFPGDEIAQEVTIEARENKPLEARCRSPEEMKLATTGTRSSRLRRGPGTSPSWLELRTGSRKVGRGLKINKRPHARSDLRFHRGRQREGQETNRPESLAHEMSP